MYVGQCFVQNYPQLYWHYYTKPKNEINAKQPVIAGFRVKVFDTEGDYWVNPIEMVSYCAASYYYNDLHVSELYDVYMQWIERIPNR